MIIKCKQCGYTEKVNKDRYIKIIGGALPAAGYYAWVTYLFAGTGLAMPIVIAMIAAGVGMLAFKDEIVKWISTSYECPKCKSKSWEV